MKKWIHQQMKSTDKGKQAIRYCAKVFDMDPLVVQMILMQHRPENFQDLYNFITPSFSQLHNPFLLNDMKKAIDRTLRAIENRERIFVFGDYDVDGQTATTLLYQALSFLNADVRFKVSLRSEGYGITPEAVEKMAADGASLIITVDNGSSAHSAMQRAKELGIDVIVTDHHEVLQGHPDCYAFINPKRTDSTYPFDSLCGAGVAFKFTQALLESLSYDWEEHFQKYIELAALGTIADMVPLIGENRTIAALGMRVMNEGGKNRAIQSLVSSLKIARIDSSAISFQLAPILNACGRIGNPNFAVNTLCNPNPSLEEIRHLIHLNNERKKLTAEQFQQVDEIIVRQKLYNHPVIIVQDVLHEGIIGILASRIAEKYQRPAIVINHEGKGSARSVQNTKFSIVNTIKRCEQHLEKYGGHQAAAGLTIDLERLPAFQQAIQQSAKQEPMIQPLANYQMKIPITQFPDHWREELLRLEPFGMANPKPVFLSENTCVGYSKAFGHNEEHLLIGSQGKTLFAFRFGYMKEFLGKFIPVLYTFDSSNSQHFIVQDLKPGEMQYIGMRSG
ncbi:single-stranded-DNA-specific exonuclease RecJ [Geobacillus sp. E263]|uniref:single-stranded-DNA-specific exonuclease RecJ n=1 Tax=Geobacillus sp. E263 TaxID=391290 RepID=UPI001179F1EC|nr:single-stranded-DNA-specific exonuclease RecJ [Geobacillus sp. E263]